MEHNMLLTRIFTCIDKLKVLFSAKRKTNHAVVQKTQNVGQHCTDVHQKDGHQRNGKNAVDQKHQVAWLGNRIHVTVS